MKRWVSILAPRLALLAFYYTAARAAVSASDEAERKTYIVHMSAPHMPATLATREHRYRSALKSAYEDPEEYSDEDILYSYREVLHGFAARLSRGQAEALEKLDGVLGVYPETVYRLHTTRSAEFLGLGGNEDRFPWSDSDYGEDVMVGVLDTGVWPESGSFDDRGMRAVPSRWKGECEPCGAAFNSSHCNKKLVGARFFSSGYEAETGRLNETLESRSPRDGDGHGTHTASTAAGSYAAGASLFGYAAGTARGMAPRARVAVYKVCWLRGCFGSDVLAGFDRAVADGVDVLSVSLGGEAVPYYRDTVAVGAFAAAERGVFVACSAGNGGPAPMSVENVAPWVTTVGASTLDRGFPADAVLGNGETHRGVCIYGGSRPLREGKQYSLIYAANASGGPNASGLCLEGTLDRRLVTGKIVLCDRGVTARVEKGAVVKSAGGAGMILANGAAHGEELVADSHLLPATAVGRKSGDAVREYIARSAAPTASIRFRGTAVGVRPAPVAAAFSARGPSPLNPQILKPDIVAPGVDILAAWPGSVGPSELEVDSRRVRFNVLSGTSMACPHLSGVAALLRGAHPDWSPAAVRSALMTTAYVVDNAGGLLRDAATGEGSNPFARGSGHVHPSRALDPGLVYDMAAQDYVDFLCALNYTPRQMAAILRKNSTCAKEAGREYSLGNMNYPSFSVVFGEDRRRGRRQTVVRHRRTVTNVGCGCSTYNAVVSSPEGVKIFVKPRQLRFKKKYQKRRYTVKFVADRWPGMGSNSSLAADFGSITWTDGEHRVWSPVAFSWIVMTR